MNDLNKQQLILLTLLVSFVTSIATGIITTALLNVAPPGVTTTINRVIEKTIQQVAPDKNTAAVVEYRNNTTTIKEITVSQDQLIQEAITKNNQSVSRISTISSGGDSTLFGLGVIIDSRGVVVTDSKDFAPSANYIAKFSDGVIFQLRHIGTDESAGLVYFAVDTAGKKYTFPPITIGTAVLGQTVVALSGVDQDIYIGHVTGFGYADAASGLTTSTQSADSKGNLIGRVKTDLTIPHTIFGGPLTDLSGNIVALRTFNENSLEVGSELSISALWNKDKISTLLAGQP